MAVTQTQADENRASVHSVVVQLAEMLSRVWWIALTAIADSMQVANSAM